MSSRFSTPVLFTVSLLSGLLLCACASPGAEKVKRVPTPYTHPASPASTPAVSASEAKPQTEFSAVLKLLRENNYSAAEERLKTMTANHPAFAPAWLNLGLLYARTNRLGEAEQMLGMAAKLVPASPMALNELGIVRRKLNRHAAAEQAYIRALALNKDYAPAHRNLGILYDLHLQKPQLALSHYRRYAELQPQDKVVNLWIAQIKLGH